MSTRNQFYDIFKKIPGGKEKCINDKCGKVLVPDKKQMSDVNDCQGTRLMQVDLLINDFTLVGGGKNKPRDMILYNNVKKMASKKFKSPSGIYRSSWIVKEYLSRGGKYNSNKKETGGLTRWFKEKWVNINKPIKNSKGKVIGYKSCGRKTQSDDKYPLCRPSKIINRKTPKTYKELSPKILNKAKRDKSKVKSTGNIKFGGGSEFPVCKESKVKKNTKLEGGSEFPVCNESKVKKNTKLESESECPVCKQSKVKKNTKLGGESECPVCKQSKVKKNTKLGSGSESKVQIRRVNCDCGTTSFSLISCNDKIECGGCGKSCVIEGGGNIKSQYKGTQSKIMVKVPENVKKTALYSYKLKSLGFKGGMETGWKRARQLSSKSEIPIEDLRFMKAWFARHIYASYPSYKKWINTGRPKTTKWYKKHGVLSWILWGGDAGFNWVNSNKNINLLNKYYPGKNYVKVKLQK